MTIAAVQPPSAPIVLSPEEAAKEGRALVTEILAQQPAANATNSGVMTISDTNNKKTAVPILFTISVTSSNWISTYSTPGADREHYASLTVLHAEGQPNRYIVPNINSPPTDTRNSFELKANELFTSFVPGSDFWRVDLGLEFFHWPEQRLIKKEMKRGRSCKVLESINPQPAPGAYSRVVSWVDNESSGIVHADAFDANGKLLKQFDPKDFKKVNGKWQLQEMQILNVQTDSSTKVDFDLSPQK